MASGLAWLRGGGPSWRPRCSVEAEVAAELQHHIDEATEEGVRAGLARDEARAAALARFGDLAAIQRQCVAIDLEGQAMWIKILATVVVALATLAGGLYLGLERARHAHVLARAEAEHAHRLAREALDAARRLEQRALAHAEAPAGADPAAWLARFRIEPHSWRLGWAVAQELVAALPADDAWSVMREVFPQIEAEQRCQALKPFVFHGGHPHALDLLDLAYRDEDAEVRSRTRSYLTEYAFTAFADGDPRYPTWREAIAGLAPRQVFERGLAWMAERLGELAEDDPAEFAAEADALSGLNFKAARKHGVDVASVLGKAGFERVVQAAQRAASGDVRTFSMQRAQAVRRAEILENWLIAPSESGASDD